MPNDELLPRVEQSLPPPLQELDWQKFERLTIDLFGLEPGIATSDGYGVSGQGDFGVDVLARRSNGDGAEAASCKRRTSIKAADLKQWSDDVLKHWGARWRALDLRRFVLATTADNTDDRTIQDQVTHEAARFDRLGVAYELWGPRQFAAKLRPHRAVAITYLGEDWARILCGPVIEPEPAASAQVDLIVAGAVAQLGALREALSAQAVARVDAALDALRSGDRAAVRALVTELRGKLTWPTLSTEAQARVLRLAASLALRDHDVPQARELAALAEALQPADEPRIAAHIAIEADGPAAALTVLGTPQSVPGRQLQVALLVMAGRVGEAEAVLHALLEQSGDDPETIRAAALVALAAGDRALALGRIEQAEALAPHWTAVLQLGAIIRYAAALSPAVPPDWILSPVAFDRSLVREDRAALQSLADAVRRFDALVAIEPDVNHHRVFRLAVLTSMRSERDRAEAEARDLLARTKADSSVVAMCLVRGVDVELDEAEATLAAAYTQGTDALRVRALGMLLRQRDAGEAGRALLAVGLAAQSEESSEEVSRWLRELGDQGAVAIDPADDALAARLDTARAAEDWPALGTIFGELAGATPPEPLALSVGEMLAAAGAWRALAPYIDQVLAFATAAAVRLAVHAAVRTDDFARALTIIDAHAEAFGEALPADIRRLRAEALAARGDLAQALREADSVAAASNSPRDRMLRAELRATAGDLRGTIPALREALDAGLLTGDRAFQWSRLIRHEEPRLARDLLDRAVGGPLDDRLIVPAMHDAMTHAPDLDIGALMGRVQARAAADAPDIRTLTIDDLPGFIAQQQADADEVEAMFLDGALPAHLFFRYAPAAFARLYAGRRHRSDAPLRSWLIRHGARPPKADYSTPFDDWRLHLDISALLVADQLGLLDALSAHPHGLRISARVPLLLVAMENGLRGEASTLIADRIAAARVAIAGIADHGAVQVVAAEQPDVVSLRSLLAALIARGALDAAAAEQMTDRLPEAAAVQDAQAVPLDGTPLRLDAATLHQLAASDLLAVVAEHHPLSAPGSVIDQVAAARVAAAEAAVVADRVAALRVRIATAIETGVYRLLPASVDDPEDSEPDDDAVLSLVYRDLIAAPGSSGDMAWIDDRLTNGYATTASMPVVGVADVIAAMVADGQLLPQAAAGLAAELRRGGALFMPPSADELIEALRAAPVTDGQVIETAALRDLRRSIAHHGRHERRLKIGDAVSETAAALDEIVPVQRTMRLMSDALTAIWKETDQSLEARIARSDWLWANTRVTHVGRIIPGPDPEAAQDLFEAMQIGHCLDQATEVGGLRDQRRSDRMHYLGWFWHRAIEPLLRVDPEFLTRLGRYLAGYYAGFLNGQLARGAKSTRVLYQLLARRIHALPEPVQGELYRDRRLATFGSMQERVTIAGVNFEPARLWRAVRIAGRYGEARLRLRSRPRGRARSVRLRRDGDGIVLSGAMRARIGDDVVAIIVARPLARKAAIAAFIRALQLDAEGSARAAEAAHGATSDAALVSALRDAREGSAAARYAELDETLRRRAAFRLDLLTPPPFASVAAALALPIGTTDLAAALPTAYRTLVERGGAAHARRAHAGIPLPQDWNTGADAAVIAAWEVSARTPLALIQAAAAAQRRGAPAEHIASLVERLLAAIVDAGPLFLSLLRWTWRLAARDPAWRAAPAALSLTLVWAHADRVLAALLDGGIERVKLLEMIEESQPDLAGVDIIRFVAAASGDAAWPAGLSPAALLYHGLGHIFGDDDVSATLSDELIERLAAAMTASIAGVTGPEARLLGRDPGGPDALGSYLRAVPRGILDGDATPAVIRARLVSGALAALVADPDDAGAWAQFGGFAALTGVDAPDLERLETALGGDGVRLARLASDGSYAVWRAVLGPLAATDPNRAADRAAMLASACRWLDDAPVRADAFRPDRATAAAELVEVAAMIAARSVGAEADRFAGLVERIANNWPAIAPDLRAMADGMITRTPSGRADLLWRMYLALRILP